MYTTKYILGVLFAVILLCATTVESKRVSMRPASAASSGDDSEGLPQQLSSAENEQFIKPVLISRRPLQQRPQAEVEMERQPVVVVRQTPRLLQQRPQQEEDDSGEQQPVFIRKQQPARPLQQHRAQPPPQQLIQQGRFKEQPQQQKEPTAQTIRNYNKLNDDGSFTFGYEADDGSFKEETRGTDCVVRGKYGYVDPDGKKQEFSYVQGNPCDPNAVSAEDDDEQPGKPGEEENIPANIPVIAPRPKQPKKNRPTTTLFQQSFGDFEQPQPQPQPQPQQIVSTTPRQPGRQQQLLQDSPRRPPQISPLADIQTSTPSQLPFRPSAAAPETLESAIRNLPQPSPVAGKSQLVPAGPNSPLYTTELVFDPATGQYNTVIFQQVPKQSAGININQRLPLAPAQRQQQPQFQPQFQPHSPHQFGSPQPQFRPAPLQPFQPQFQPQRPIEFDFQRSGAAFPQPPPLQQQQLAQQQQSSMFQQSQNLFRQQQKQQQQQAAFQPQSSQFFPPQRFASEISQFTPKQQQRFEQQPEAQQQQFVLVQPGRTPGQQSLAAGQIDAFLRGHNVQF